MDSVDVVKYEYVSIIAKFRVWLASNYKLYAQEQYKKATISLPITAPLRQQPEKDHHPSQLPKRERGHSEVFFKKKEKKKKL